MNQNKIYYLNYNQTEQKYNIILGSKFTNKLYTGSLRFKNFDVAKQIADKLNKLKIKNAFLSNG